MLLFVQETSLPSFTLHPYKHPHTLVHTITDSFPSLAMQTIQRSYNGSVLRGYFWSLQYMTEKLLQISEDRSSSIVMDFTLPSIKPRDQA